MALLRRLKNGLKKIASKPKRKPVAKKPEPQVKKESAPAKDSKIEKDLVMGTRELEVGKTKFSTPPEPHREMRRMVEDLPGGYGEDRIVLQVRDPWWLHSYWEVTGATLEGLKGRIGDAFYGAKMILRVYDISHIHFNGKNAHRSFDIEVGFQTSSWYIDTAGPGRSWCVEVGLRLASGEFIKIARSNIVHTPLEGPSWVTDEQWMVPDEMFARLYGMGFGFGRSSPVGKAWQERMRRALFSGILASPGMASMASPVKKVPKERKFWLVVNAELIVYGATEPDAKVTIQGRPLQLRPDGTFSVRFALPDGRQVIPVKAVSSDNVEERTITPIVSRETKSEVTMKAVSGV